MRSLQLQAALSDHVEAVAVALHGEIAAGAEVQFELEQQGGRRAQGPTLYCYRPLTQSFIEQRLPALERLDTYAHAAALLGEFDGLERYLASAGVDASRTSSSVRVRAALGVLLGEVFAEQTDFQLRPERLEAALGRLERAALSFVSEFTLVGVLHGLTITSPELALTAGLTIAQPDAIDGLPAAATAPGEGGAGHLVVVLSAEPQNPRRALEEGGEVMRDLLRALRLFGDGRVTLGALAWARLGDGAWSPHALGAGGRPHGMLVVTPEQEDELRAFCSLVSRRAPHGNELAWALRRFELGCERATPYEAITDHLLALRALLEPEGSPEGLLSRRLAALCATADGHDELIGRIGEALALERSAIAGTLVEHAGAELLAQDVAAHLRALLRDVICGHLDANLAGLADELLQAAAQERPPPAPDADEGVSEQRSIEQVLGDASQAQEVLDVFI